MQCSSGVQDILPTLCFEPRSIVYNYSESYTALGRLVCVFSKPLNCMSNNNITWLNYAYVFAASNIFKTNNNYKHNNITKHLSTNRYIIPTLDKKSDDLSKGTNCLITD